jgi:hypothetical protein
MIRNEARSRCDQAARDRTRVRHMLVLQRRAVQRHRRVLPLPEVRRAGTPDLRAPAGSVLAGHQLPGISVSKTVAGVISVRPKFRIRKSHNGWIWECTLCRPATRGHARSWRQSMFVSRPHHFRVRSCHHRWVHDVAGDDAPEAIARVRHPCHACSASAVPGDCPDGRGPAQVHRPSAEDSGTMPGIAPAPADPPASDADWLARTFTPAAQRNAELPEYAKPVTARDYYPDDR